MAYIKKMGYLDYITYNQNEMAEEREFTIGNFIKDGDYVISNQNGTKITLSGGIAHIGGFYIKSIGDSYEEDTDGKKFIGLKVTSNPAKDENSIGFANIELYVHPSTDEADFNSVKNKWVNDSYIYHIYTKEDDGTFTRENTKKGYTTIDDVSLFSSGGQLWVNVNGHDSNKLNVDFTGITQRVLTLEDLGIVDADFPATEDNDAFCDFIFNKLPKDSMLMTTAKVGSNISKNFPFQDGGIMTVKRFSGSSKYEGTIEFILSGSVNMTTANNTWLLSSYKDDNDKYITQGYAPLDGASDVWSYKIPNDTEYNFTNTNFQYYDAFSISFTDDSLNTSYANTIFEGWLLDKTAYLSHSYYNGKITTRSARVKKTSLYVGKREYSADTSMMKGIVIVGSQIGKFKNSKSVTWENNKKATNVLEFTQLQKETIN